MGNRTLTAALVLAAVAGLAIAADAQARGGRAGGAGRGGRGGGLIPPLLMKTDAFEDGGIIPERYAGRGGNVRPGFTFSNIPDGTVSFAIIFHDLDVAASGSDDVLTGWRRTFPQKRAASRKEACLKARLSELQAWAADAISDLVPRPGLGTITTSSNSTR